MTVKRLQSKAENKTVSTLVDADPRSGPSKAERLETLGPLVVTSESNDAALTQIADE